MQRTPLAYIYQALVNKKEEVIDFELNFLDEVYQCFDADEEATSIDEILTLYFNDNDKISQEEKEQMLLKAEKAIKTLSKYKFFNAYSSLCTNPERTEVLEETTQVGVLLVEDFNMEKVAKSLNKSLKEVEQAHFYSYIKLSKDDSFYPTSKEDADKFLSDHDIQIKKTDKKEEINKEKTEDDESKETQIEQKEISKEDILQKEKETEIDHNELDNLNFDYSQLDDQKDEEVEKKEDEEKNKEKTEGQEEIQKDKSKTETKKKNFFEENDDDLKIKTKELNTEIKKDQQQKPEQELSNETEEFDSYSDNISDVEDDEKTVKLKDNQYLGNSRFEFNTKAKTLLKIGSFILLTVIALIMTVDVYRSSFEKDAKGITRISINELNELLKANAEYKAQVDQLRKNYEIEKETLKNQIKADMQASMQNELEEARRRGYETAKAETEDMADLINQQSAAYSIVTADCIAFPVEKDGRYKIGEMKRHPINVSGWIVDPQSQSVIGVIGSNYSLIKNKIQSVLCFKGQGDIEPRWEEPVIEGDGLTPEKKKIKKETAKKDEIPLEQE